MTTPHTRHDRTGDAHPPDRPEAARLDAIFEALTSRHCRVLLDRLADADDALAVGNLATALADDATLDEADVRTVLHHTHLPTLDDAGLLEYDADRGVVRPVTTSQFEALRETVAEYETADLPIPLDELLALLADFRRRTAYRVLLSHDELSLPDLADEVAVAEREDSLPEIDPDEVLEVYFSLYHTHVPKLADAGLVTYDQPTDHVSVTETGRALESPYRALADAADG